MSKKSDHKSSHVGVRILLFLAFLSIFGGGLVPGAFGFAEVMAGNLVYGSGLMTIGLLVIGTAAFLGFELPRQ